MHVYLISSSSNNFAVNIVINQTFFPYYRLLLNQQDSNTLLSHKACTFLK